MPAHRLERPHEAIPLAPRGVIGTSSFRRTLAWHVARRLEELITLAIQYGHTRTVVSAGYAAAATASTTCSTSKPPEQPPTPSRPSPRSLRQLASQHFLRWAQPPQSRL
jgi:hypothetical protein